MIPRLPLKLIAALILAPALPPAHASAPISWDTLVQGWKDGTITETVFELAGDGSVSDTSGAISIAQGSSLTLDGHGHTLSSTEQSPHSFSSRAFDNKGTLEISNCTITGNFNTALSWGSYSSGGAITNGINAQLNLSGCSFSNNGMVSDTAGSGGALYGATGSVMTIQGCEFNGNYVSYNDISHNSSERRGGAISSDGTVFLSHSRFSGNYASFFHTGPFFSFSGGGAVSLTGLSSRLEGDSLEFHTNHALGFAAMGGAIQASNGTRFNLSNSVFTNNYVFCTADGNNGGYAYGGAFSADLNVTATFTDCAFEGNHASSLTTTESQGGAISNLVSGTLTLINCSFYNNYVSSGDPSLALGGAINSIGGSIRIIANGKDSIFQGNREQVSATGGGGVSNAIRVNNGTELSFYAGNGGSLIFYDGIKGDGTLLTINKSSQEGHPVDGAVFFKDGASIDGFNTELHGGSLSMGEGTSIHGALDVWQGSTLMLDGFTTMDGQYSVHAVKPGITHSVLIRMTDAMAEATEERPVWTFTEGSSISAFAGSMDFVLDISQINVPYDELHPFIFSHDGQTQELMDSVNNAKSVRLVDADGWSYYVKDSFFDYLSGQNGSLLPPGTGDQDWKAPAGVGGIQGNSQWTAVRSLRSFSETARTRQGQRLKPDGNAAFWITATGDYFTQSSQASAEGYRFRSHGYSVGGSYDFSPVWTAGAAFGQSFGTNDVNNDMGSFDQDAVMALLQLNRSVQLGNRDFLLFSLQGGYGTASSKGGFTSPDLAGERLEGSWKDQTRLLDLQGMWTRELNRKTRVGLYSGLQYMGSSQSSSTAAGERYAYRLEDSCMDVLRGRLGVEFHRTGSLLGKAAAGYVRTGITHDLDRKTPHVTVHGVSRSWTAPGSKPDRTALQASAGFQINLFGNWNAGVDYSVEAGNRQLDQSGRIGVMLEF